MHPSIQDRGTVAIKLGFQHENQGRTVKITNTVKVG